jgi:hypothetical protein
MGTAFDKLFLEEYIYFIDEKFINFVYFNFIKLKLS